MAGLGKAGSAYANEMSANFHVPPTVKIPSGVGIGILFMKDFKLPAKGGNLMGGATSATNPMVQEANSSGATAASAALSSLKSTGTQFAQTAAHALGSAASGQSEGTNG